MQVRLLLGVAGSGKTFRCLSEVRQALAASPEGPPLVLVAPRQGTYQLEQQLLASPSLGGYTRLSIVSFESLARSVFSRLGKSCPRTLTEEGRLMVLRGLLAAERRELKLFRASARLTGFAQQLSQTLSEVQRAQFSPTALRQLATQVPAEEGLAPKLEDLATLLEQYLHWLESHQLQDDNALLRGAVELLRPQPLAPFRLAELWVDGFAEFSELELDLLCSAIPHCDRATVTFCLDTVPAHSFSWLSHWSAVGASLENCRKRLVSLANVEVTTQVLPREGGDGRFVKSPVLQHLENCWAAPRPYQSRKFASGRLGEPHQNPRALHSRQAAIETFDRDKHAAEIGDSLRIVACVDREAEVALAAREIIGFVHTGARYRDVSVLLRKLEPYFQIIQRVFSRYEIPFFLDRRESISHHPLAELTRSAVRVAAFGWQHEDWFAALKSGLVAAEDEDIDLLENEALARGWRGRAWHEPIHLRDVPKTEPERQRLNQLEIQLEQIRRELLPPFEKLMLQLATSRNRATGPQLAAALRELWDSLSVEQQLQAWTAATPSNFESRSSVSVHETVWQQMNDWLDNAELAFPTQALPLREWVPILEAGLANLTVGIIPPALDQVLVGAVDRSRTPEVKLALVLGLNEGVFPATPESGSLLTETDRLELEKQNVVLGSDARRALGRERYLAYIACTRAREKLILTRASQDPTGAPLNPSWLLAHVNRLFPALQPETAPPLLDWRNSEHVSELVGTLLRTLRTQSGAAVSADCGIGSAGEETGNAACRAAPGDDSALRVPHTALLSVPGFASLFEGLRHFRNPPGSEALTPELAARLYGPVLRTSVSRMEQFAACPFKFFVHSGLRAEERKLFELDAKEQGTFQHDVLALFHEDLIAEGKRWRDITTADARGRVGRIARGLASRFRDGLLETSEETRFTARVLTESLQDFVETLVGWMHSQYRFDPVEVELPFGEDGGAPAWALDLGDGQRLELHGRIDRVDIYRTPESDRALCVIIDYKSSQKQLDPLLVAHGLQLQLLTYLNVVRQWPNPRAAFSTDHLEPAGVFYVNLRGKYGRELNRIDALADPDRARKLAYRHSGRFDLKALPQLDGRPGIREGDQFNYRLTNAGQVYKSCKEAVASADFEPLLLQAEDNLRRMGKQVYSGHAEVGPYRKGAVTACAQCTYQAICRIDPWTHQFRVLRRGRTGEEPPDLVEDLRVAP